MISILSLVTSIKDYLEVVHKFIEYDSVNINYAELGSIITFFIISIKDCLVDFFSFSWLLKENLLSLPIIIPDISSAMISEISVLDGYFHNAFNFLDTPVSYGGLSSNEQNGFIACLEKLVIGGINSIFLFLPTSTAHIITLRRFVMQGLEAGYISGLGTIAGNVFWLGSVILGFRFFVIPWLSLDIFRYVLGFILLVKYMWDSYNERKISNLDNAVNTKRKIFLLNFLLALTEQTSIYPFISNISVSPEASILENFSLNSDGGTSFIAIHLAYLVGITVGSLSLLHLSCWFWENPAFKLYMWVISSFKVSTSFYYKVLNFTFLYLTMLSAVCSIPYYGLDYTITNPLGYVSDDRLIQDKVVLETSFLGTKASDRNTRRNRGRHGRRERWKRRIRKYRAFDASLYDQGIYDLFTIEDLNYGFDRFWLRRKLRNHRVRFRFFPGPWMRSFKKQLAKPRLESYTGPRVEFFRILYEQVYHPSFHAYNVKPGSNSSPISGLNLTSSSSSGIGIVNENGKAKQETNSNNLSSDSLLKMKKSTLRKFIRKLDNRIKTSQIINLQNDSFAKRGENKNTLLRKTDTNNQNSFLLKGNKQNDLSTYSNNLYDNTFNLNALISKKQQQLVSTLDPLGEKQEKQQNILANATSNVENNQLRKQMQKTYLSNKDSQILQYRTLLKSNELSSSSLKNNENTTLGKSLMLLHPLKFYLQQENAFKQKLRYYTPSVYRKFSVENNAPYFRVMMKRYFYNFKPNLRWERTMKAASLRKARRKTARIPRKLQKGDVTVSVTNNNEQFTLPIPLEKSAIQKSSYNYSVVSKRASRYRYQIYKDVLQHWYYSPFNRLLLKLDVDNFIRRQPNAHFLTAKEENLLHLRRFLLFEHYNTLRWYTNMEHYRSMKTSLNGGTKSFSSRAYNQQFFGTFKKIRHLFAITPSISTVSNLSTQTSTQTPTQTNVLKFDQLLYNEYPNSNNNPLLNPLIIHEELLPDYIKDTNTNNNNNTNTNTTTNLQGKGDLLSQSKEIVGQYLINTRSTREEYIKKLLSENNYSKLAQFIYKGQKVRGNEPVTNERLLNNQEKDYLLTSKENNEIEKQLNNLKQSNLKTNVTEQLYLTYLKNLKHRVNDQESIKNYLTRRLEKREKRKQKKEKQLLTKLKRLETWLLLPQTQSQSQVQSQSQSQLQLQPYAEENSDLLTSGLQKSILEGMYVLNNVDKNSVSLNEKNMWKVLLLSKIKEKQSINNSNQNFKSSYNPNSVVRLQDTTLRFNDLQNVKKIKLSNDLKTTVQTVRKLIKKQPSTRATLEDKKSALLNLRLYNSVKTKLKNYRDISLNKMLTAKDTFLNFTKFTNVLKPIKRKSLKDWRKKERVLGKQKRLRKEFKLLNKKTESTSISNYLDNNELELALQTPLRKKRDNVKEEQNNIKSSEQQMYITNSFKRKRSPQRRSRIKRNRGVFKKRTLTDLLRKDFSQFSNEKDRNVKAQYYEKFNENLYATSSNSNLKSILDLNNLWAITKLNKDTSISGEIQESPLKQRKSKQRKERYWKQKRSKYSQKRRKYRKRRRYTIVKIRNLNKQFKRIKNQTQIKNWWWKQYIPSIQASNEALWQIERDKLIQQKLSQLTTSDILERDNNSNFNVLQIGNKDFKPLALPEAIRLMQSSKLEQQNNSLSFSNNSTTTTNTTSTTVQSNTYTNTSVNEVNTNLNVVNSLYESLLINDKEQNTSINEFLLPNTNLPFYAGWDESLRKLIVTNRMLSRKDAGFTLYNNDLNMSQNNTDAMLLKTPIDQLTDNSSEFTLAPLQGMNAATTLYWQIPFTTYDPDQFFALGMDGFSPLGWRKFLFRHSILKTWLGSSVTQKEENNALNVNTLEKSNNLNSDSTNQNKHSTLIVKTKNNIINDLLQFNNSDTLNNSKTNTNLFKQHKQAFATSRRLKKRYRRVKKHPRTPVWFPSGPLANQVLPVHYIYVFYKKSRLPRDRYLKRRLLNVKNRNTNYINTLINNNNFVTANYDFTLRKRLKPKRKYHLKRDYYAANVIIPRRFKFMSNLSNQNDLNSTKIWRPLSSLKIHKPIAEVVKEQQLLRRSALQRTSKQQPNIRVKQLRRRVQRQILRTTWRYRPRAGGFVWPGDYLQLELVKAPKLQSTKDLKQTGIQTTTTKKQKRKKKRTLVEWQIQPKKYLYQKHNLKVLKKKLQKSLRSTGSHSNNLNVLRNLV